MNTAFRTKTIIVKKYIGTDSISKSVRIKDQIFQGKTKYFDKFEIRRYEKNTPINESKVITTVYGRHKACLAVLFFEKNEQHTVSEWERLYCNYPNLKDLRKKIQSL